MRPWIFLLGLLGVFTTSCLGFTVDRSRRGIFNSRNWSSPISRLDRRASVDTIFNGEIHSADIENMLRDSEMREFIKLPDEKCSSPSKDPNRGKRSEVNSDTTNHITIDEKIDFVPKESTIVSASSETKSPGSTIVSSPKETKNSGTTIVSTSQKIKTSGSTVALTSKETETPQSTIVPKEIKLREIVPIAEVVTNLEITSKKSSDTNSLRNVVLLLVDDAEAGQEDISTLFQVTQKFPVRGILQACRNSDFADMTKFSLGDSQVSRRLDDDCDCDHMLRANIASLFSWARQTKEMTISTVSTTNFSIPLTLGYESPKSQFPREFEDMDEMNGYRQEIPRTKSDPSDMWRLIDVEKPTIDDNQSTPSVPPNPSIGTMPKQDGVNGFNGMWNVFDMFTKIRVAFFRILLESLGNMAGMEDEPNGTKTLSLQPKLVDLMTDAIGELKSMPNDNGFILVAAAPKNELSAVVDLIEREVLTKDTLLVISGVCSPTNEPVSFFARGPGENSFREARTVWGLPGLIRDAITDGCFDKSCKKQLPEEPVAVPSLELSSFSEELMEKRISRAAGNENANQTVITEGKSLNETNKEEAENDKIKPRAGKASHTGVGNVTNIFRIITSIVTMLALNSS